LLNNEPRPETIITPEHIGAIGDRLVDAFQGAGRDLYPDIDPEAPPEALNSAESADAAAKVRTQNSPRNNALASASKIPALYAPPIGGGRAAAEGDGLPVYYHYEPSWEEAEAVYNHFAQSSEGGAQAAFRKAAESIRELETDSEAYQRYADTRWQAVWGAAERVQVQRAIRVNYVPDSELPPGRPKVGSSLGQVKGVRDDMFDSALFGLYTPAAEALDTPIHLTPIGQALKREGWGTPRTESDAIDEVQHWSAELAGTTLGLLSPFSPAGLLYKGLGKLAAKAPTAAGRLGQNALADSGIDMTSSIVRQALESGVQGVDYGDAALEGIGGAVIGGGANLIGEWARKYSTNVLSTNKELQALDAVGIGRPGNDPATGKPGALVRAYDRLTTPLEDMWAAEYTPPRKVTSSILENAREKAGRVAKDTDSRLAGTLSEEAALAGAAEVLPVINKRTQALQAVMSRNTSHYLQSPAIQGMTHRPQRTFKALLALRDSADLSSSDVRKATSTALANISDVRVVNLADDVGGATRKAAEAKGGVLMRLNDSRLKGESWARSVANARNAHFAKQSKAHAALVQAQNQAYEAKVAAAKANIGNTLGLPGHLPTIPKPDPIPKPANDLWVVVEPAAMDAGGHIEALALLDAKINYESAKGGAPNVLRTAAESMRADRSAFPGMDDVVAKNRRIITKLESMQRATGMTTRQLAGTHVDAEDLGLPRDQNLAQIAEALKNLGPVDTTRASNFMDYLDNPELNKIVHAIKAAEALEAANKGGGGDISKHIRGGISSKGNTYATTSAQPTSMIQRFLSGRSTVLREVYESGDVPKRLHVLFQPDTVQFLQEVDPEVLEGLVTASTLRDAKDTVSSWMPEDSETP
jgi:hypothetical protein